MASWQSIISLENLHEKFEEGEIELTELVHELIDSIKKNKFYSFSDELVSIVEELEMVSDEEDYDFLLERLYDFGDIDHRIFIRMN